MRCLGGYGERETGDSSSARSSNGWFSLSAPSGTRIPNPEAKSWNPSPALKIIHDQYLFSSPRLLFPRNFDKSRVLVTKRMLSIRKSEGLKGLNLQQLIIIMPPRLDRLDLQIATEINCQGLPKPGLCRPFRYDSLMTLYVIAHSRCILRTCPYLIEQLPQDCQVVNTDESVFRSLTVPRCSVVREA